MSEYDQYLPKGATTSAPSGSEYDQYIKPGATQKLPGTPGFGSGGFGAVTKAVGRAGTGATKTVGRAIVGGHKDPVGYMLSGLDAPQRGLQALETGADPGKAWNDPKQGPALAKAVKE